MTVGTITDLSITKNYADDTRWTEAQLDAFKSSIETFVNTSIARNLEQVAKDAFGNANYTLDSDGSPNLTNTLFNKQSATDSYNGGDISLGTSADVSYAAVDAVNAAVTITPEIIGKYRAVFTFSHIAEFTATTEGQCETSFLITDGTTNSSSIMSGGYMPATAANSGRFVNPISITHEFNFTTTSAKTITLQKFNRTMTAVNANSVGATSTTGEIYMVIEKV